MQTTILLCIASTLLISSGLWAADYTFDASSDTGTYVVLWGNRSGGPYTHYKEIGTNTSFTTEEIGINHERSGTYYIVVYLYNHDGVSGLSNEAMFTIGARLKDSESVSPLKSGEGGVILK